MFGGFFGEYLVNAGVITAEQLQAAVAAQRENNALLGHIAISQDLISKSDLEMILSLQIERHKKLGTIAVESGILTTDQVQELLTIQAQNHQYLGDALVRLELLDSQKLAYYIELYNREMSAVADEFMEALELAPGRDLLFLGIDSIRSFFFRLGDVVKIDHIDFTPPDSTAPATPFLGTLYLRHKRTAYLGLVLPEAVITYLARGADSDAQKNPQKARMDIEYLEQLFFNLNYYICNESRHIPTRARHGPIRTTIPSTGLKYVSLRIIGLIEPFHILYATPD